MRSRWPRLRYRLRAVQRQHHPDMRVHQRPAIFRRHDDRFASRLPFRPSLLGRRQLQDIRRCVFERYGRPALRRFDWLVEGARPGHRLAAFLRTRLRVDPVMSAGKVRPVAGLAQSDHFGRDVLLADETLSDGPVAVCWPRSPIAWCSVANLETMNLLASDHVGERVRGGAVTGLAPFRTVDATEPDLDVLRLGSHAECITVDDTDHRSQVAFGTVGW